MENLAYASIQRFSDISLRLEQAKVNANHEYIMTPICAERFVYITEGKACFFIGEKQIWANNRDMVYLPGETAYHSKWYCESKFMVVDMQLCDEKGERIHLDEEPCVLFNDKNHIYDGILISLAKKSNTIGPFDWLERLYLSFKLLCQIARDTTSTEVEDNLIKKGVTYLENNYTQNFNVDILADMCAISPGYFRKLFNECKGTSPTDYRNRLRIQYASELLKKGAHTVGEAAELVGISDIKYFSKLFVRYTGMKPSEFKKQSFIKK